MTSKKRTVYVEESHELDDIVDSVRDSQFLALDTEFVRERTYLPRLCLIQAMVEDTIWCVDAIRIPDLRPLLDAMLEGSHLTILHAAYQDLEIIFNYCGRVPAAIFDTQIAAAFAGRSMQIAYAGLVEEFYGVKLDKNQARTDWAKRPLSHRQLNYAAADVQYLIDIKTRLDDELRKKGRAQWVAEENRRLSDPAPYLSDPELAWRRMKGLAKLEPSQYAIAVMLAVWREKVAQAHDIPRPWVVPDECIYSLAKSAPCTKAALAKVDGVKPAFVRRWGSEVIETIATASTAIEELPCDPRKEQAPKLTASGKSVVGELLNKLRACSERHDIAAPLIATRRDIEAVVGGQRSNPLFDGWRKELFGEALLEHIDAASSDLYTDN